MKRFALLILLILLVPSVADAVTYYVKKSSTNATNCLLATNPAAAVNTFKRGLECMVGGDTLELMANTTGGTETYQEDLYSTNTRPPSGTPAVHTTIKTFGTDTIRFTHLSSMNWYTGNFQYVDFIGGCTTGLSRTCRMIWDGGSSAAATAAKITGSDFSFNNDSTPANNLIFDGVRITGWGHLNTTSAAVGSNSGVQSGGHNNTWRNSRIDNNGWANDVGGGFPAYGFYIAGTNLTIENCEIDNNGNYAIHQFKDGGGSGTATGSVFRFNTIHNNGRTKPGGQASGDMLIGVSTGSRVYGNLIYGSGSEYGIRVDYNTINALVYNNTVYGSTYASYGLADAAGSVSGNIFRNNIAHPAGGAAFSLGTSTANTFSNNLCTSNGTGCDSALTETAAATFNNPGTDFTLKTGSKAIDGGTPGIGLGVTIPACTPSITSGCYNGSNPDVGALETGIPTSGGPPLLTTNLTTVAAGASILLTVDDNDVSERVENNLDWVGSYVPGTPAADALDWFYMNGTKVNPVTAISDAVIAFTAPLTPGDYEFRFYANGSGAEIDRLATVTFTVVTPGIVMKFNISALKIGPSVTLKIGTP